MDDSTTDPPASGIRRHALSAIILLLGSAGILVTLCVVQGITLEKLGGGLGDISVPMLFLVIVLSAAFHIFAGADKLRRVLRAMDLDLGFADVLRMRLGSGPLRLVIPFKAGELATIAFLSRFRGIEVGRATGVMVFDRSLNIAGTTFWLLIGALLMTSARVPYQAVLCLTAGLLYVCFFFLTPMHGLCIGIAERIHGRLGRFVSGLLMPLRELSPGKKLFFLAYGFLFQTRNLWVCWLLFLGFGWAPSLSTFIGFVTITQFAGHLPAFAELGPKDAVFVALFQGAASPEVLLSVSLLMTLCIHIVPSVLGLPWVPWFVRGFSSAPERRIAQA